MNTYLIAKKKKELKLTNKDIAEMIGVSVSTVSKICSNNFKNPSEEIIENMANVLKCSKQELKLDNQNTKQSSHTSKEDEIKKIIIERYGSINKFSKKVDIVPATISRILNEGLDTATFGKISVMFKELNLSLDNLSQNEDYIYSELEKSIILNLKKMNSLGLNKILIYTQDILKIEEYQNNLVFNSFDEEDDFNVNYITRRARNEKEDDEKEQTLMEEDFKNMLELKNKHKK